MKVKDLAFSVSYFPLAVLVFVHIAYIPLMLIDIAHIIPRMMKLP